jgi:hypothetical protein
VTASEKAARLESELAALRSGPWSRRGLREPQEALLRGRAEWIGDRNAALDKVI